MASVPQPQADSQAVRDELAGIAATLVRVQEQLTQIMRRSEEEYVAYQARIADLEDHNREVLTAAKWLRAQNVELERMADQHKPEMDRAIEARDAAFRKLHHSRKVIRDLLDESKTGFLSNGNSRTSSEEHYHPTDAQKQAENFIQTDLGVKLVEDDSSTDSDSDETVRLKRALGIDLGNDDAQNQTSLLIPPSNHEGEDGPSEGVGRKNETRPESDSESSLSLHPSGSGSSSSEQEVWNIQYSKPPSSTELTFGPLMWTTLPARLRLDEEAVRSFILIIFQFIDRTVQKMDSLESLGSSTEQCLRLQITRDMAFVYDPIFLESSSASYLIDWGRKKVNQRIEKYINQGLQKNPVLHTFVFPIKKGRGHWFYVGAHTWIVTELWKVWPTLSTRSKHEVTTKLMGRCDGGLDQSATARLMDEGTLEQICVQISGTSHREESRNFARRIGYRGRRKLGRAEQLLELHKP